MLDAFRGISLVAATITMGLAVLAVPSRMRIEPLNTLTLRAPGRLHLGFLDPSGSLGRRFGSIGLVVDGFETEVELSAALADRITADTPEGTTLSVIALMEGAFVFCADLATSRPIYVKVWPRTCADSPGESCTSFFVV